MIKTIFFDFGGVISDNANAWDTMYKRFPEATGLTTEELDNIFFDLWPDMAVGNKNFDDFLEKVLSQAKKTVIKEELRHIYSTDVKIDRDILAIIKRLKERGLRVVIFSNDSKEGEQLRLKKAEAFVDHMYSSATIGLRKPDPQIYNYVVTQEKIRFDEALLIDDLERNILTAKELGIKGILYRNVRQLENALQEYLF